MNFKRALSCVLALAFVAPLAGCGQSGTTSLPVASNISGPTPDSVLRSASGTDIFEGLLFGEGPVSQLFPEFWSTTARQALGFPKMTAAQHALYLASIHTFERDLSKEDPGLFSALKIGMTSGDPTQVQDALNRVKADGLRLAAAHHIDVATAMAKYNPAGVVGLKVAAVAYVAALGAAVYQSAAAVWFFVAAAVAVVTVLVGAATPLYAHGTVTHFTADQAIALITQRLSRNRPYTLPASP